MNADAEGHFYLIKGHYVQMAYTKRYICNTLGTDKGLTWNFQAPYCNYFNNIFVLTKNFSGHLKKALELFNFRLNETSI